MSREKIRENELYGVPSIDGNLVREALRDNVVYGLKVDEPFFPKTLRFKVYSDEALTEETSYYVDVPCYDGGVCDSKEELQSFMQNLDPTQYKLSKINFKELDVDESIYYSYHIGIDKTLLGEEIEVTSFGVSDRANSEMAIVLVDSTEMLKKDQRLSILLDFNMNYFPFFLSDDGSDNGVTIDAESITMGLSNKTHFFAPTIFD